MSSTNGYINGTEGEAGPSRIYRKAAKPFIAADHRPEEADGVFRVVLITSGSVASIRAPNIVAELCKTGDIAVQVVATKASTSFYTQFEVDEAVRDALGLAAPAASTETRQGSEIDNDSANGNNGGISQSGAGEIGVRVWTDEDEWGVWKKVGDPILHIELRRWTDLVVVAPCSADILAKIAGGLCDNLATSLLRALSPSTPVTLCPAMNTHMYQHPFTCKHLKVVQEELGYLVLGPQGTGKLACGDEGPGKMTDWREIVDVIKDFAQMKQLKFKNIQRLSGFVSHTNVVKAQDINIDLDDESALPSGTGIDIGRQWQPRPDVSAKDCPVEACRIAAQNGSLWAKRWWG